MGRKKMEINLISNERLSSLLKEKKIKQSELAEKLNYTPQQISRIVTGKERLTEDFARKIIELFKTGDLETDMFDTIRYEWLMGLDNFKTEGDRMDAFYEGKEERTALTIRLVELCGYSVKDINVVCLKNGDNEKTYLPGMTLEEAFMWEQKNGTIITKDVKYDDFIQRTEFDSDCYFFFRRCIEMKSPRGSKRYFYKINEFFDIINAIIEFTECKCAYQFRKLDSKGIYKWC